MGRRRKTKAATAKLQANAQTATAGHRWHLHPLVKPTAGAIETGLRMLQQDRWELDHFDEHRASNSTGARGPAAGWRGHPSDGEGVSCGRHGRRARPCTP